MNVIRSTSSGLVTFVLIGGMPVLRTAALHDKRTAAAAYMRREASLEWCNAAQSVNKDIFVQIDVTGPYSLI